MSFFGFQILQYRGCTIFILYQIFLEFEGYFDECFGISLDFLHHLSCTWSKYRKSMKLSIKMLHKLFCIQANYLTKESRKTLGVINIHRKTFITMVTYILCYIFQKSFCIVARENCCLHKIYNILLVCRFSNKDC